MYKIISRAFVTTAITGASLIVCASTASADLIGDGVEVLGIGSENVGQNNGNSGQANSHNNGNGNSAQQAFTDNSAVNVLQNLDVTENPLVIL